MPLTLQKEWAPGLRAWRPKVLPPSLAFLKWSTKSDVDSRLVVRTDYANIIRCQFQNLMKLKTAGIISLIMALLAAVAVFISREKPPPYRAKRQMEATPMAVIAPDPYPDKMTAHSVQASKAGLHSEHRATHLENAAAIHSLVRGLRELKTGDTAGLEALLSQLKALMTTENVASIIKSLSPEEFNTPFGAVALDKWLDTEPIEAAKWIGERSDHTESNAFMVGQKLQKDFSSLESYCDSLPPGQWKQEVLNGAALAVLTTDTGNAVSLAQRMSPGALQTNLMQTIAYDLASRDPVAAANWVASVADPGLRSKLAVAVAINFAQDDPAMAAVWAQTAIEEKDVLENTLQRITPAAVAN